MSLLTAGFRSSQGFVRYGQLGAGAPIILVHGTPGSSFVWSKVAPRLAEHWQVTVYDMPGYGASDKFNGQDVRLRAQAGVLRELLAHLKIERPHLVGHDFGAAAVLGAHAVEKVEAASLIVIDGVVLNPWGTPYSLLVQRNIQVFEAIPPHIHKAALEAHLRRATSRILDDATMSALLSPWLGEAGQAAYYRQVAQYDHDFTARLETLYPGIKVPTHILWATEDQWIAAENGPRLQRSIPGATLDYLKDAGHFAMLDTPDNVADRISGFLRALEHRP